MSLLRIHRALDKALRENQLSVSLDKNTRIVIFSDLHRGTGDWADDFMRNAQVFDCALRYYLEKEFTYIELGDGDELYENRRLFDIVRAHGHIFRLLDQFHKQGRMIYVCGNHNWQLINPDYLSSALRLSRVYVPGLFPGLKTYPSLFIGDRIFLIHGHKGDLINDDLIFLGRFFVRYFWRGLQNRFGMKDPTSPAQNWHKRRQIDRQILNWARKKKIMTVAGHTHRPMFSSLSKQEKLLGHKGEPYYFNAGSGVHPRCVTCLEIKDMMISLVKWSIAANKNRTLHVQREVLPGCRRSLEEILSSL
jgi:hypothetical protein